MITSLILVAAVILTPTLPHRENIIFRSMAPIEVKYINGLPEFMRKLGKLESDNTISATNRYGMLGKYQFHISTIRSVGMKVTRREFLSNSALQDTALVRYLKSNKEDLLPYIQKYSGTRFRGIDITESGILAGAHFAGSTGVINFFKHGTNKDDANGTTLTKYMKQFNGFDLKI